jgi:hypothetical protein
LPARPRIDPARDVGILDRVDVQRAAAAFLLALLAPACVTGVDPNSVAGAIREEKQARSLKAIRPPSRPDLTRTGRVGVVLGTNSVGWRRTLGTPSDAGAVVLFIAPGSPAAAAGLLRGDLIVKVGSERVRNDERASAALRGRPGEAIVLRVTRKGRPMDVRVVPSRIVDVDLPALYDHALREDPRDPTALLLRAQSATDPKEAISFVNRALDVEPNFVDALVLRARLFWSESQRVENEAVIIEDQRRAHDDYARALRIDPRSTGALVSRGHALFAIQGYADAERDALRAIAVDASHPGAYLMLAKARLSLGRTGDSAAPARQAVRLAPYDAETYRILALSFIALGRREDAKRTVDVGHTVALDDNQRAALRAVLDGRA